MANRSPIRDLLLAMWRKGHTEPDSSDAAADARTEWLWPRPGGRRITIGPAGGPPAATVDVDGMVTPLRSSWSVEVWIGASDQWHVPSRRSVPRQRLLRGLPVIETPVRIPGGEAVIRTAYAPGGVLVEVENASPTPFALSVALVPATPDGQGRLCSCGLNGTRLVAEGQSAVLFGSRPRLAAVGSAAAGHVINPVTKGEAAAGDVEVHCQDGMASVAAVVPVTHGQTTRFVVAAGDGDPAKVLGVPLEAIVGGWERLTRTGPKVELPDRSVGTVITSAVAQLSILDFNDSAHTLGLVAAAMSRWGRHSDAETVLRELWSRLRSDGSIVDPEGAVTHAAEALWALDQWRRLAGHEASDALVGALAESLAPAAGYLDDLSASMDPQSDIARWATAGLDAAAATMAATDHPFHVEVAAAANRRSRLSSGLMSSLPPLNDPAAAAMAAVEPGKGGAITAALGALVVASRMTTTWSRSATAEVLLALADWLVKVPNPAWPPASGEGSVGMEVLRAVPPDWRGAPFEVLELPVEGGRLSYALRWHGDRPALLWDIDTSLSVRLSAPGYSSCWVSDQRRGEKLLVSGPERLEGSTGDNVGSPIA